MIENGPKSTILAIKAMRKQLKQLEAENFELKYEKKRLLKLQSDIETKHKQMHKQNKEKTKQAKQILKTSSIAFSQISDVRNDILNLRKENEFIETLLYREKQKGEDLEAKFNSIKSDYKSNEQRLKNYQKFIGEFLAPPDPPTGLSSSELIILSADDSNIETLDEKLVPLYESLCSCKKKFQVQDLNTRKETLEIYCKAHSAVEDLSAQISFRDKKRLTCGIRNMSDEIVQMYKDFFVIVNEMKKFDFN